MRELALCQTESGFKVLGQVCLLLHCENNSLVNPLLVGRLGFWERLLWLWLALLEEFSLRGGRTLHSSLSEVSVVDFGVKLSGR
jgi:hypothetical protein